MVADATLDWLLDSDPAIRWQVMADLTEATPEAVETERSRVAKEGWGARLLGLQSEDGNWGGGSYSPKWISTTYTLLLLRHLGVDPADPIVRAAIDLVEERVTMGGRDGPFFEYATETCVTGMALALGAYYLTEVNSLPQPDNLLAKQLDDGGWNCRAIKTSHRSSFHTTISVLEGLLEYEKSVGGDQSVREARAKAHEYLLARRLMFSLSSGDLINERWLLLSFPPRWHYDILRALDYLRDARLELDDRGEEAIQVVEGKRRNDGTWPLQNHHAGREHFKMEDGSGKPSRWNTLRALRVLDWHRGGKAAQSVGSIS